MIDSFKTPLIVVGRVLLALMFILARGGETYARLRFDVGPGAQIQIPVTIDYGTTFAASDVAGWEAEYRRNVQRELALAQMPTDLDALDEIAWSELARTASEPDGGGEP